MQLSLFNLFASPQKEKPKASKQKVLKRPTILSTTPKPSLDEVYRKALKPYLPEESLNYTVAWFAEHHVQLRISRSRSSKLGDYRYPKPGSLPKISINHNLNPYSFLITLVHEMAHHDVYRALQGALFKSNRRKKSIKPHGDEWKAHYRQLMHPLLKSTIFPPEILSVLIDYFDNPRASSTADHDLARILKTFDQPNGKLILESLPMDALFKIHSGRTFQKKEKVRTRYRCICLDNKRTYLFNPLAEVFSIS